MLEPQYQRAPRRGDLSLWGLAFVTSLLVNMLAFTAIGFVALRPALERREVAGAAGSSEESVAMIFPEPAETSAGAPDQPKPEEPDPAVPVKRRFARTSDDQIAPSEGPAPFIGERNTLATSDRAPVPGAPPLPSQTGIQPRFPGELETTESTYQDGELEVPPTVAGDPAPPATAPAPAPTPAAAAAPPPTPVPAPRETLYQGPDPVDVEVARSEEAADTPKPTPPADTAATTPMPPVEPPVDPKAEGIAEERPKETTRDSARPAASSPPAPQAPAFKGHQRKTAVVGSISRSGRSALHVADTPLGRYQATVSRAVEQEWQRACIRRRDFITPGFLTVRFFVEPSGRVRSVQALDDKESGQIQKGFTLESIRKADIPAMPPALRADYESEPLELEFRFYF